MDRLGSRDLRMYKPACGRTHHEGGNPTSYTQHPHLISCRLSPRTTLVKTPSSSSCTSTITDHPARHPHQPCGHTLAGYGKPRGTCKSMPREPGTYRIVRTNRRETPQPQPSTAHPKTPPHNGGFPHVICSHLDSAPVPAFLLAWHCAQRRSQSPDQLPESERGERITNSRELSSLSPAPM